MPEAGAALRCGLAVLVAVVVYAAMLATWFGGAVHQTDSCLVERLHWRTAADKDDSYDFEGVLEYCSVPTVVPLRRLARYNASADFAYTAVGYRDALRPGSPCRFPGPTLVMKPGGRYRLTLRNGATGSDTNLHFHGLHISQRGNGDAFARTAGPGQCLVYNLSVPADHSPGSYWYHAHLLGASLAQTGRGAYGAIVIEDEDDSGSDAPLRRFLHDGGERVAFFSRHFVEGTPYDSQSQTGFVYVNGRLGGGDVLVPHDRWVRVRVLLSSPNGWDTAVLNWSAHCDCYPLARDGIYLDTVPDVHPAAGYRSPSAFGRLDLAVRCRQPGVITWLGAVLRLQPTASSTADSFGVPPSPFAADGTAVWRPRRPAYLQSLLDRRDALVVPVGVGAKSVKWNGTVLSNGQVAGSYPAGTLFELHLTSTAFHPFHVHAFPVQIASPDCGPAYPLGAWFDTVQTSQPCVLRLAAVQQTGSIALHCHGLYHEDHGAFIVLNISNGQTPDQPPIPAQSCL